MVELGPARGQDREQIAALLATSGLPNREVEPHLAHFTVAREGGRVVGVIGLEVHGQDGVLRSLAVEEGHRGRGIARRLYAALLAEARRAGVARLFLLAPAAQRWFTLLGFRSVPGGAVPETVGASEELQGRAVNGAMVMVRSVPRG